MDKLAGNLPSNSQVPENSLEKAGRRCLAPARFFCSPKGLFVAALFGGGYWWASRNIQMLNFKPIRALLLTATASVPLSGVGGITLSRLGHSRNEDHQTYLNVMLGPEWQDATSRCLVSAWGPLRAARVVHREAATGTRLEGVSQADLSQLATTIGTERLTFAALEVAAAAPTAQYVSDLLKIVGQVDGLNSLDLRNVDFSGLTPRPERELIAGTTATLTLHPACGYPPQRIAIIRDPFYQATCEANRAEINAFLWSPSNVLYEFLEPAFGPAQTALILKTECVDRRNPVLRNLEGKHLVALRDRYAAYSPDAAPKFTELTFENTSLDDAQYNALIDILRLSSSSLKKLDLTDLDLQKCSEEKRTALFACLAEIDALEELTLGPGVLVSPVSDEVLNPLEKAKNLKALALTNVHLEDLNTLCPVMKTLNFLNLIDSSWGMGSPVEQAVELSYFVRGKGSIHERGGRSPKNTKSMTIVLGERPREFVAALAAGYCDLAVDKVSWVRKEKESQDEKQLLEGMSEEEKLSRAVDVTELDPPSEEFKSQLRGAVQKKPRNSLNTWRTASIRFQFRDLTRIPTNSPLGKALDNYRRNDNLLVFDNCS